MTTLLRFLTSHAIALLLFPIVLLSGEPRPEGCALACLDAAEELVDGMFGEKESSE